VPKAKRTVQYWVEQTAEKAAEETGDDDYRRISTHDLRRCWANHLLVEQNVSPRIVMALGDGVPMTLLSLISPLQLNRTLSNQ